MIIWPTKLRILFKTISATVAGIFLWNQICWAGDIYLTVDDFNDQQVAEFAPDYFVTQDVIQQNVVDQEQLINDMLMAQTAESAAGEVTPEEELNLQGPMDLVAQGESSDAGGATFSVRTVDGDIIYYVDGRIDSILKNDGTLFEDVILDNEENLLSAIVTHNDGSVAIIENSLISSYTVPDGTVYFYQEGVLSYVMDLAGGRTDYTFQYNAAGDIIGAITENTSGTAYYNENNNLVKVEKPDGTTVEYENGYITYIIRPDGGKYIFQQETQANGDIKRIIDKYIDSLGNELEINEADVAKKLPVFASYSFDSSSPVPRELNPHFIMDFAIGLTPGYSNAWFSAYYSSSEKYVSLRVTAENNSILIYKYISNRATGLSDYEYTTLPGVTVNGGVMHAIEAIWENGKVNMYLTEKGSDKSSTPIYTLDDAEWDPRFSAGSYNAEASINPECNVNFSQFSNNLSLIDTTVPYNGLTHKMFFTTETSASNKEFYIQAQGMEGQLREYITFSCRHGGLNINKYIYNYDTHQSTSNTYYVYGIDLDPGKNYVLDLDVKEGLMYLFLYEKDTEKGEALYSIDTLLKTPRFYSKVRYATQCEAYIAEYGATTEGLGFNDIKDDVSFSGVLYDSEGKIKEVALIEGGKIIYTEDGLIDRVLDSEGNVTDYDYAASGLHNIMQVTLDRNNLRRVYDVSGVLNKIVLEDGSEVNYRNGELNSILTSQGKKYLYTGGTLSGLMDDEGTEYTLDSEGRPVYAKDKFGREYKYTYTTDTDGTDIVITEEVGKGTLRTYKNDLLMKTEEPYGLIAENTYYEDCSLKEVIIHKNGETIGKYSYTYEGGNTIVEDIEDNVRTYGETGRLYTLYDKNKNLYKYTYIDDTTTTVELIGRTIEEADISYDKWDITSVTVQNGLTYSEFEMDDSDKILTFKANSEDGFQADVSVYGNVKDITLMTGEQLLYHGEDLIAIYTDQGVVYLADNEALLALMPNLPEEVVENYRIEEYFARQEYNINITNQSWRPQYYWNTKSFESLIKDYENNQLIVTTNIIAGDREKSQGEIFLDTRYSRPEYLVDENTPIRGAIDCTGKEISFLVKLPEGTFTYDGRPLYLQAYAKDESWRSQYGTAVSVTEDGSWYRVSLMPCENDVAKGLTNNGFDPTRVAGIGVKLWAASDSEIVYQGDILIKNGVDIDILEGETYQENPLLVNIKALENLIENVNSYSCLLTDEKNFVNYNDMASIFGRNAENPNLEVYLDDADWHIQRDNGSNVVNSITRDDANDQWAVNVHLNYDDFYLRRGEAILDLRHDIPGLTWQGPVDLTNKELRFKIKAPEGAIDSNYPVCARAFIKDENYKWYAGPSVNITKADTWYELWVRANEYVYNFDSTSAMEIGIDFWTRYGSDLDFTGDIYIKEDIAPDTFKDSRNDALYVDVKSLKQYAKDNAVRTAIEDSISSKIDYILENLYEFMLDDKDDIIAQEFKNDKLIRLERGNKTITHFRDDGDIDFISNLNDQFIVDYEYDTSGNFTGVTYYEARRRLENSVLESHQKVSEEKRKAAEELAEQRGVVVDDIRAQVAPDLEQLYQQRDDLQNMWNDVNDDWVPFWEKKNKSRQLDEIARAIDQMNSAIDVVNARLSDAYGQVDEEVAKLAVQIDNEANEALAQIEEENKKLLLEIIKEENSLVVVHYYRELLGRDPDGAELESAFEPLDLNQQKIDAQALRESILSGSEYNERASQIESITSSVTAELESYLLMSDTEKETYLASLGLVPEDAVPIYEFEIQKITEWLENQSKHFGYSAFRVLEDMFGDQPLDRETLAKECIVVDALTGVIDMFSEGDLTISMNAIRAVALAHGLELWCVKAELDDLASSTEPVIVHTKENHYIIVTKVEGDAVYYKENSRGENGTEETMSLEDFLEEWDGYAITKEKPVDQSQVITQEEAMEIKGAGIGALFLFIAWLVTTITATISGIVTTIAGIITGIGMLVAHAIVAIGTIIQGIGVLIVANIGATFAGLAGMFAASGLIGLVTQTVIGIGLSFGLSMGLTAIGVDPVIANLTTAFLTGGVLSCFTAGALGWATFLMGGLEMATIEGINMAGASLSLPPAITSILSITAGGLTNGVFTGDYMGVLEKIAPQIASECAYFGVQTAGEMLGIDPRISNLAGIGIRSSLQAGMHSFGSGGEPGGGWFDFGEAVKGAVNGLLRGITNVALQWAAEELEISPLLAAISSNALAGAIEGLLEDKNPLRGIFDSFYQAGLGFLTLGGPGVTPWEQAAYAAQILDFTRLIREEGIGRAIEIYATGFFHQTTINSIWKLGGIYDILMNPNQVEITINDKGETVKRIYLNKVSTNEDKQSSGFIDLSLNGDKLVGRKEGNVTEHCEYKLQPDGSSELVAGERVFDLGNGIKRVDVVEDFKIIESTYYDSNGNRVFTLLPREGNNSIKYDASGNPSDFRIEGVGEKYFLEVSSDNNEMRVIDATTNNIVLSFDCSGENVYNTIGNADIEDFLITLTDKLASEANSTYKMYEIVGKIYNSIASKYTENYENQIEQADSIFKQRIQEMRNIRTNEMHIANERYNNNEITYEEYQILVQQIQNDYDTVYAHIDDVRRETIENIHRLYPIELPQVPILGESDE